MSMRSARALEQAKLPVSMSGINKNKMESSIGSASITKFIRKVKLKKNNLFLCVCKNRCGSYGVGYQTFDLHQTVCSSVDVIL